MSKTANSATDILECAICLGDLCQPRALPCLHSFCEKCLERHISLQKSVQRQQRAARFTCPKCREPTLLPQNGVSGFRKDFRTARMTEILSSISATKNSFSCDVCLVENKKSEAVNFCLNCKKYLCGNCGGTHKEIPVLQDHHLVDIVRPINESDVICEKHENETCNFFCETCNSPTCLLCIVTDHKNHCTLDFDLTISYKCSDMRTCLDRLSVDISKAREYMTQLSQEQRRLRNVYEESKVIVKKKTSKIVNKIIGDESKFISEIERDYQQKKNVICDERDKCNSYGKGLNQMKERVENILRFENPSRINASYVPLMRELEKINEMGREIEKNMLTPTHENNVDYMRSLANNFFSTKDSRKIKFWREKNSLPSTRHDTEAHELVKDNMNDKSESNSNNDPKNRIDKTHTQSQCPMLCGNLARPLLQRTSSILTHQRRLMIPDSPRMLVSEDRARICPDTNISDKYNGCLRGRQLFQIGGPGICRGQLKLPYSLCFTVDDMLVVAENGNKRLQVFDANGNVDDVIKVGDSIPRSVTDLGRNELAFTDEQAKTIQVYSRESHTARSIDFKQTAFPYGITSLQSGSLVISDMIYENIQIVSPLGQVKLEFGSHGSSANNRFDNPSYLATRQNNIFVSDSGNHEIKVFNDSGEFVFKFGSYGKGTGQMRYPKGIAIDEDGRVFVADSGNDRVVRFSASGEGLGTVLRKEDGIRRPSGIAYSSNGRLAVALPDINEVRVYQMALSMS